MGIPIIGGSLYHCYMYRNKSAENYENRNNPASIFVPPEQIRRPEQIRCDTGQPLGQRAAYNVIIEDPGSPYVATFQCTIYILFTSSLYLLQVLSRLCTRGEKRLTEQVERFGSHGPISAIQAPICNSIIYGIPLWTKKGKICILQK